MNKENRVEITVIQQFRFRSSIKKNARYDLSGKTVITLTGTDSSLTKTSGLSFEG